MTIEYRMAEYDDFDVERVVEITRAIRPDDYESVAALDDWHDAQRKAGRLCVRWLASVDGQIVGSAYVGQSTWLPPTTVVLRVAVRPDHQGASGVRCSNAPKPPPRNAGHTTSWAGRRRRYHGRCGSSNAPVSGGRPRVGVNARPLRV